MEMVPPANFLPSINGIETRNLGIKGTGGLICTGESTNGASPVLIGGTLIWYKTVSIQNVAFISTAWALGPRPLAGGGFTPSRKAMLASPPPNSGAVGVVEMSMT